MKSKRNTGKRVCLSVPFNFREKKKQSQKKVRLKFCRVLRFVSISISSSSPVPHLFDKISKRVIHRIKA